MLCSVRLATGCGFRLIRGSCFHTAVDDTAVVVGVAHIATLVMVVV